MTKIEESLYAFFLAAVAFGVCSLLIGCAPHGPRGVAGAPGAPGIDGRDGVDGRDGQDGEDGRDGVDAILEVIDPCGDEPGVLDEVLFRMHDGQIFAYFERGGNRYLTLIPPGTYQTTDGTKCTFKVTNDGEVK